MTVDLRDFNPAHDLNQVPAAVKQAMREKGMRSTFYLANIILGYDKLTARTHGPLCTFLDTCQTNRRMIQMPRSHFKTTLATVAHRILRFLNAPERRTLIVGDTLPNARKHLAKIKLHFEGNRLFRWLYPDFLWDDTAQAPAWSQDQIFLPVGGRAAQHGEPTFDVIGARGAVVSRHYEDIDCDDIIGEQDAYSPTDMDHTIEWFTGLESLFVPPMEQTLMDIPSTFWRTDDVYAFAEAFYGRGQEKIQTGPYSYLRGDLAVFRRGAVEDGKPIFPEAFKMEFFTRLQEKNSERYAAQYANNPFEAANAFFQPEYKRYYDVLVDNEQTKEFQARYVHPSGLIEAIDPNDYWIVSMCDPHAGGSNKRRFRGGRAAVITTGVRADLARVVIFDCWIRRAPTNVIIDEIFRQNDKWGPNVFSIEANGLQKMLKYWIDERTERDNRISVPYQAYIPKSEKDSEFRIKGLQPLFRAGQILGQRGFIELWEEYAAYPRGTMDGLDALAQGLEYWNVGWDPTPPEEVDAYEAALRRMRSTVTGY